MRQADQTARRADGHTTGSRRRRPRSTARTPTRSRTSTTTTRRTRARRSRAPTARRLRAPVHDTFDAPPNDGVSNGDDACDFTTPIRAEPGPTRSAPLATAPGTRPIPTRGRPTASRTACRRSTSSTPSTTTSSRRRSASTPRDGNFEGDDPVERQRPTTAPTPPATAARTATTSTTRTCRRRRTAEPAMQMYLFASTRTRTRSSTFRNINGGDDAGDGLARVHARPLEPPRHQRRRSGAIASPHTGAMGEAWSDWYALDLLHRRGLEIDSRGAGAGRHRRLLRRRVRVDALRAGRLPPRGRRGRRTAPAASAPAPAATRSATSARSPARPEVHSDGEIWTQTLWELRSALVADARRGGRLRRRRAAGHRGHAPVAARAVVPRHAQRDPGRRPGSTTRDRTTSSGRCSRTAAWASSPASPTRATPRRPRTSTRRRPPNAPKGRSPARVTSADTGCRSPACRSASAASRPTRRSRTTSRRHERVDAARYSLAGAGRHATAAWSSRPPGFDRVIVATRHVPANGTGTLNVALRRDWAATQGRRGGRQGRHEVRRHRRRLRLRARPADRPVAAAPAGRPFNPASADPENPHARPADGA